MDQDEVNDIPSVAEEFWAALATNDRSGAQQVVDRLALPPVETSAFSFEEVEGELEQVRGEEGGDGGSGALSPKAVNSDTPVAVVETWNSDVRVALVLVSKDEICGARVSDGEVDFHACAGALDREGGTSCGWSTHETDGKDAKGRKSPQDGTSCSRDQGIRYPRQVVRLDRQAPEDFLSSDLA